CDDRFAHAHGLLHQYPVYQLIEPIFVVVEPVDIGDGSGAGARNLADALERDRAEATVEIGDGPGLRLGPGTGFERGHDGVSPRTVERSWIHRITLPSTSQLRECDDHVNDRSVKLSLDRMDVPGSPRVVGCELIEL